MIKSLLKHKHRIIDAIFTRVPPESPAHREETALIRFLCAFRASYPIVICRKSEDTLQISPSVISLCVQAREWGLGGDANRGCYVGDKIVRRKGDRWEYEPYHMAPLELFQLFFAFVTLPYIDVTIFRSKCVYIHRSERHRICGGETSQSTGVVAKKFLRHIRRRTVMPYA